MLRIILVEYVMGQDLLRFKSTARCHLQSVWMAVLGQGSAVMSALIRRWDLILLIIVLMLSQDVLDRDVSTSIWPWWLLNSFIVIVLLCKTLSMGLSKQEILVHSYFICIEWTQLWVCHLHVQVLGKLLAHCGLLGHLNTWSNSRAFLHIHRWFGWCTKTCSCSSNWWTILAVGDLFFVSEVTAARPCRCGWQVSLSE